MVRSGIKNQFPNIGGRRSKMKGNYYLFSPLVDEKGEVVVREERADDWVETEGPLSIPPEPFHVAEPEGCTVRLLTMKKFDHDPLARIREVYDKFYCHYFPAAMKCEEFAKEVWLAISETVKEMEEK